MSILKIPISNSILKIPVSEYREIEAVNFSSLKYMGESPMSYDWHKKHPISETSAMAFGTAFHASVLEPEAFAAEYVVAPVNPYDGRSKEGKAFKKDVIEPFNERAEAEGLKILTAADLAELQEMALNFRSHPHIAPFLTEPGTPEVTLTWTDEETGIACKGRLDRLLADGRIFGVKTTGKFQARQFASHAWELGYHAQWAFYYDGAIANGLVVPEIVEGVISTNGPYDCALYAVDSETLKRGRDAYRGWLRQLAVELENKKAVEGYRWPGQYPDPITFRAPAWAGNGEYELEHSIGAFVDALKQEVK